jgi:acyl-coenzyme A thioesterase PaaI-like protein
MVEELQHVPVDEFWDRFKSVMGPDGLMTYRYLGSRSTVGPDGDIEGAMAIRRDMRNPAGGLMAAPISIALADAAGVVGDAISVPAPVISSVHLLDPGLDVNEIRVRSSRIHDGRTMGFSDAVIYDAARPDRIVALTRGMGVKLAEAPPGYEYVDPGPGVPDSPDLPPLHEAFGARRRDDGQWAIPQLDAHIGSTSGSLHHGATQVLLEAAAMDLATDAAGNEALQIEDWDVMFVARGLSGPFVASGDTIDSGHGRVACRMTLRDEGNGDRVIASALAVFRRSS